MVTNASRTPMISLLLIAVCKEVCRGAPKEFAHNHTLFAQSLIWCANWRAHLLCLGDFQKHSGSMRKWHGITMSHTESPKNLSMYTWGRAKRALSWGCWSGWSLQDCLDLICSTSCEYHSFSWCDFSVWRYRATTTRQTFRHIGSRVLYDFVLSSLCSC